MEKVSITRCPDYQYEEVQKSVFNCLDNITEIKRKINSHARVLVKVNLLRGNKPEDAITTHPSVVQAIVRYFQGMGCSVIIGDSPGSMHNFNENVLSSVYKITGMMDVAKNTGCELNFDSSAIDVLFEEAKCIKKLHITKIIKDVDFVISAAKLKTHTMMTYTGAVKNLFGVIPGRTKIDYHLKMNDTNYFSELLVDICEYVRPVLSIIDAIEGMEGNGPAAGEKRQVGLILASENPHILDVAASHIIGINPLDVPTIMAAKRRDILNDNMMDFTVSGVQFNDINIPPFKLPVTQSANILGGRMPRPMEKWVLKNLRPRPIFNHDICTSCGLCKESCPPGAIDMSNKKPSVNLDRCIRCFCCHELCPRKAVDIKKHWIYERILK